jgi:hypothetical protein
MTTWRMRTACWIPKASKTHSEHVILIAFPRQQCLHGRASMLRHTYIACLADFNVYWKFLITRNDVLSVTPFINRQTDNTGLHERRHISLYTYDTVQHHCKNIGQTNQTTQKNSTIWAHFFCYS